MWLEKKREEGYTFLTKKVDCQVVLGDNTTVQSINEQVWIPVSFKDDDTGDIYIAPIKFSVLHMDMDDSGVPLIIGLPSIGRHFTKLVIKMLERNAILYEDNDEEYFCLLQEYQLYLPWSVPQIPTAEEELDSYEPQLFDKEILRHLSNPTEAQEKYFQLLETQVSPDFKERCPELMDFLRSKEVQQTFLPSSWEGFKNIQAVGANEKDEIEICFKEDFPTSLPVQPRPIANKLLDATITELKRLETYLWRISNSAVASPLVVAPKATHPFIRIAGDYRIINDYVYINQEYIPLPRHELNKSKGFNIFLDFDMTNSFHQIKLGPLSSSRLAVSTYIGLREPKFLPEGVSCGSMLLQKIVRYIFREISDHSIILFDNFLLLAHDYEDAFEKMKNFFRICRQHNVILKLAKTMMGFTQVSFFGYIIKDNTISLSPARKHAISLIQFPTNKKLAQSFLLKSHFSKQNVKTT
jgi:hypothetical protein